MFLTFNNSQDARDYRREHGTGGWIFEPTRIEGVAWDNNKCILFPPEYTPTMILNHQFTKSCDGRLIGCN